MGDQYYRTEDHKRLRIGHQTRKSLSSGESFVIPPGQFAFLLSKESVNIPKDTMALISMRTAIKFSGLINVSGFHVDPGYNGKLVFGVYNASPSPIHLSENEQVFKIWICKIDHTSAGKYVKDPNNRLTEITSDMIRGMNREILSLQSISNSINSLKTQMKVQNAIFYGIIP